MRIRDRISRYAAVAVAIAVGAFAVWIYASGGLERRQEVGTGLETARSGTVIQRDTETGHVLWELLTGEVEREAGSPTGVVKRATCRVYTGEREEMMVKAEALQFDAEGGTLTFTEGVEARSGEDAEVAYEGSAERMIYRTAERHAHFEEEAVFQYGRSTFYGSAIDAWFEPAADGASSKLSRCEVIPMPSEGTKRAAIAVLAMASMAAAASSQQEMNFRNAVVRADNLSADITGGAITLVGDPEIEVGETIFSADVINVKIDPDHGDQVLYADTIGDVQVRSAKVTDPGVPSKFRRKERVITLTARTGRYSAEDGRAVLEGGVRGVMARVAHPLFEGMGEPAITEDATFDAAHVVADFDETGTPIAVSASGSPAALHYVKPDGSDDSYWVRASSLEYALTDPPTMVASGNPSIENVKGGSTYRANRIVAHFEQRDVPMPVEDTAGAEDTEEDTDSGIFLDRVELVGSAVLETRTSNNDEEYWFLIKGDRATALLPEDGETKIEVRGSPSVVGMDTATGEETIHLDADTVDVIPDQQIVVAVGNVSLTSEDDAMTTTADRAEMDASDEVGRMKMELSGNVHSEMEPATKEDRPVIIDGQAVGYHKPDRDHTWLYLTDGTFRILPIDEEQDEMVLKAPSLRMDRKTGQLEATGRPTVRQGESTFVADRLELKLDPDTNDPLGGIAQGNVTFHTRVEQKPTEAEGADEPGEPKTLLVDGQAERAVLTPQVTVPPHVPGLGPNERADRVRMSGSPELVVIDEETGSTRMTFRNVRYIDIYLVNGATFIDSGGASGGPAEMSISGEDDTPGGGDE